MTISTKYDHFKREQLIHAIHSRDDEIARLKAAMQQACVDCGEPVQPVANSGDQGRCAPYRAQH